MERIKQLHYDGQYGEDEYSLSELKIEDVPTKRRRTLSHKYLCNVTEDEFEEWLAVKLNSDLRELSYNLDNDSLTTKAINTEDKKAYADYYRAEYNHIKKFAKWEKENLLPLVKEMTNMAKCDPQYDYYFLYKLERQKLVCMERYLTHSRVADNTGNYVGKKWLLICITLLDYILEYKKINKSQIVRMIIKNIGNLTDDYTIQEFKRANFKKKNDIELCDKCFYGQKIYIRKIERLYHLIRIHKTRFWWE